MTHRPSRLISALFSLVLVVCTLCGVIPSALGKPSTPPASSGAAAPTSAGESEVNAETLPWVAGPKHLSLDHGIEFDLPAKRLFLAQPYAGKLLERQGNLHNEDLLGIVIPEDDNDDGWLITLRFEDEGFIKDDDKPDAKEILEAIREGEPDYNKEREKRGFDPIHAEGWKEEPHYDPTTHQLEWALLVATAKGKTVNLNTRILGRKGFVAVNFLVGPEALDRNRVAATEVRSAVTFGPGHRYEEFDAKKDKVAEYGLTGLVLGGAGFGLMKAAKIGLLAKFGKLLLAGLLVLKKGVVFVLAGIAALFKKLFGGRNAPRETSANTEGESAESSLTPE
jgi:uncharacterized membrane-anchored protein